VTIFSKESGAQFPALGYSSLSADIEPNPPDVHVGHTFFLCGLDFSSETPECGAIDFVEGNSSFTTSTMFII